MDDIIRVTRGIHYFVRGELPFEQELALLKEIVESDKWFKHFELELILHEMAQKNQISDSTFAIEIGDNCDWNRQPFRVNGAESNYSG